jgi:hypothetical protein
MKGSKDSVKVIKVKTTEQRKQRLDTAWVVFKCQFITQQVTIMPYTQTSVLLGVLQAGFDAKNLQSCG